MSRYDKTAIPEELTPEAIHAEVERILASEKFARSKRLRTLLRFTVAQTLQGNADMLKEYVIGTEVLKKPDSYDPRSDSLVRVLASRLRVKLKEYYSDGGSQDPLVIEFPKGKYVPRFQRREQLQSAVEKKLRARNAYSRGRFLATSFHAAALAEAATHYSEAIEAEPDWPQARIGLASVHAFEALLGFRRPREVWPAVKLQADSALQLDELSPDGHICMGMAQAFCDWRWHDAELHFLKAIERDNYSGAGHLWRAVACLIPAGKIEEAMRELEHARDLAAAPFLEEARLLALYFAGQYDAVILLTERTEAGALPAWRQWLRGCALAALRRSRDAIALFPAQHEDARITAGLGFVSAVAGDHDKALEALSVLSDRRARGAWVSNYDLAVIQNALGNRAEALALLQEALREREPWIAFMAVDPRLAALRPSPKFEALARRTQPSEIEMRENTAFLRKSAP